MTEVIAWGAMCVLALIAGLYAIAAAPMRYNGGRSDARKYRGSWHLGEKLVMLALLVLLSAVAVPVMILREVAKDE